MNTVTGSVLVTRLSFVHTHAVSYASSERAEGERRGTNSSVEAVTDLFLVDY